MEKKEKIDIQPEQNEETRIQKNEERLRNLWDNCKCSNVQIISVPEGEQEKQKTENLFEQIMKENFPHLPHSHTDKPGRTTWERDRPQNPGFQRGKLKTQNFWL